MSQQVKASALHHFWVEFAVTGRRWRQDVASPRSVTKSAKGACCGLVVVTDSR